MVNCDTYFIGYDAREHEAAAIAAFSIQRRATRRSQVFMVEHQALRRAGLFTRPWRIEPEGQFYDQRDGRPFSTAFSHSRFLVFHLANALKFNGPCMFVDCDWLFLADPGEIMRRQEAFPDQIGVVSRDRVVEDGSLKMDGMVQSAYPRKLWSAMFTFMPSPCYATLFAPEVVNTVAGRDLHGFLGRADEGFWQIDPDWHYIPSLDERPAQPRGIHFSEFSPWLNPERGIESPDEFVAWHGEREAWLAHAARSRSICPWDNLTPLLSSLKGD